jgi:tight adherence protein B
VLAAGGTVHGLPLWAVCALAFVAILALTLLALLVPLATRRRREQQERLDEVRRYRVLIAVDDQSRSDGAAGHPAPRETTLSTRALALADVALRRYGDRPKLVDRLDRAGLRIRPEEWAVLRVVVPAALAAAGLLVGGPIGLLLGTALGVLACSGFVRVKISRRRIAFETALPDSLELLAGALRTGFGLNQAMQTVVREGIEPVATEFGRTLHEVRLGAELEDALDALAERMSSLDLKLVVMAIRTAREVGGNLAEVLDTAVQTMRERSHLRGQVRTLSAEGRFSAKVLIALPLLMAAYLLVFKRSYLTPLYSTGVGVALLVVGVVLLLVGALWLTRMTKIEV